MTVAASRSYRAGWCTAWPTGGDARRGGVGARAHEAEREASWFAEVVGNHQVTDAADGDAQGETGGDAVEDRPQRQSGSTDDGEPEGEAAGPRMGAVEPVDAAVGPDQGVLHQVFGIGMVRGEGAGHPQQHLDLRQHEQRESFVGRRRRAAHRSIHRRRNPAAWQDHSREVSRRPSGFRVR